MHSYSEKTVISCCGLVCSNCGMFVKGKCKGCHGAKPMNRNCKIKACVYEKNYKTCADCTEYTDLKKCSTLHNFISIFFGFIFRSDRIGNLYYIREHGIENLIKKKRLEGSK